MADGGFGMQDFRYLAEEDEYLCPVGERRDDQHDAAQGLILVTHEPSDHVQSCRLHSHRIQSLQLCGQYRTVPRA